jgi:type II secretory pathway component GspD/PulD (secretin)
MMDKCRPVIGIFANKIRVGVRVSRLAPLLLKGMRKRWLHWADIGSEHNRKLKMKLKFIVMSLVGLAAASMIALARQQTPATDNNQSAATPAIAATTTPATETPATTPAEAPTTTSTAATADPTPAATAAATPATQEATNATATTTQDAAATNAVATGATNATPATTTPAGQDTSASTNATAASSQRDPNTPMPLIVMDDVPLTDAIKNLARQANLNYMLDPKINYGGTNPDGTKIPQPSVSLRWENLTANEALTALLNTYNLTIADDPKSKVARITVKDPAAPEPLVTKIIQLKYSDPTNMLASIQTVLLDKRSKVVADTRTSQLVLVATEKEVTAVDELVGRLDTQTRQVLIETKFVETSKNPSTTKGIDWTGTLQAQHFSFGNNVNGGQGGRYTQTTDLQVKTNAAGTPLDFITTTFGDNNTLNNPRLLMDTAKGFNPATAFLDADGLSAVLSFLNTEAQAKVLSTPRAVTLDNQEATLSVTTAQPIFLTTAGTQGSPGGSQVTYTNLGTILKVTPRISANNTINLKVVPEVSDLGAKVQKTVSGQLNEADSFNVRKIETHVLIPSGNTLVMGGLVKDNTQNGNIKVPILGDIPGFGWAFRQESKLQDKRNMIVFITPTIVEDGDFTPTPTDFLHIKPSDTPSAEFGAWDSGKPQDWSKLFGGKKDAPESDSGVKYPDATPK